MTLLCDYEGKCEWRRETGSCGAYCPHADKRRLWTKAAWAEEKRHRRIAAKQAREAQEAAAVVLTQNEESTRWQEDASDVLDMMKG